MPSTFHRRVAILCSSIEYPLSRYPNLNICSDDSHARTRHKLSKRFKLAARGKKKKGHQVSLLMNNAASMNLLSRLIGDPLGQQPPFYSPRGRVSWRETVSSFDFIFTLNLFTRADALDLCGHAKRRGRGGRHPAAPIHGGRIHSLLNETFEITLRFQCSPPPVPPSRATFPFRWEAKEARGDALFMKRSLSFQKYIYFFQVVNYDIVRTTASIRNKFFSRNMFSRSSRNLHKFIETRISIPPNAEFWFVKSVNLPPNIELCTYKFFYIVQRRLISVSWSSTTRPTVYDGTNPNSSVNCKLRTGLREGKENRNSAKFLPLSRAVRAWTRSPKFYDHLYKVRGETRRVMTEIGPVSSVSERGKAENRSVEERFCSVAHHRRIGCYAYCLFSHYSCSRVYTLTALEKQRCLDILRSSR